MGPGIHPHTLPPRPQRSQPKPATTRTHKLARDNLYHPRGNTYFFKSQFLTTLPYPSGSYAGKNIIVTGSNTGLGLEAARHFVRLGCSRMILAVRNLEKGNQAKASIEHSTGCSEGIISVWELDLCSYSSVQSFASRVSAELERVDILLLNAGVCALKGPWRIVEEDEEAITVNVVTTFLLAFLLFPKLRETARLFPDTVSPGPTMTVVTSLAHTYTDFRLSRTAPEGQLFKSLSSPDRPEAMFDDHTDQYFISKLLQIFLVRAMAAECPVEKTGVTINCVQPGFVKSGLFKFESHVHGLFAVAFGMAMNGLVARSTECGSRTLMHAASQGGKESGTHGGYLSDCMMDEPGEFVTGEEGRVVQERVWRELRGKVEGVCPGVLKGLEV
ncbi:hypothetical protein SMACR_05056 [Sordaria macrospora]|uniref:WGS project CABT00000000 data, contig 2.22 n=2 Tax=Sordaria macrospora TaxID=5147 RepID=F7W2J1_SORMK|nr:uncharacterized protein SMAC_05056 [Sordaria macrospora k-hell]KAA8633481.1 hypothetical protein SMACR_05056 [Sordaria macrospora]KAH7632573.1 hypothetical protein B0T09DRAFT_299751 [Sordaria sp. MPI-SDFR-AT-0083]WPJ60941.1 hypothetical protein SMAC4_05056 [Sordaria macrospora]CCC11842.1 unnamed protein product [Sordaria macrospora k-hell]